MEGLSLKTAHCAWCEAEVTDDSVDILSCECGGLAVCMDCFDGEDGIKQELGIDDSAVLTPFVVGEGANQTVGGYADGKSIACKECVSRRQNVAFTPRKKGSKAAKSKGKGKGTEPAKEGSEVVKEDGRAPVDDGPSAERIEVLLDAVAEAGSKPGDLSRLLIWKDIRRSGKDVHKLAVEFLGWVPESEGEFGRKMSWPKFRSALEELLSRLQEAGGAPVAKESEDVEVPLTMARSRLGHVEALIPGTERARALHEFLTVAPALVQKMFTRHLGWSPVKKSFDNPEGKKKLVRQITGLVGEGDGDTDADEDDEAGAAPRKVAFKPVNLRDEGEEEAHLMKGGSRYEGQSGLAREERGGSSAAGASGSRVNLRSGGRTGVSM
eukprot:CAMPEP_0181295546 /NCGR_PEP_ID=MMETSP1101-20121128/4208_1 /TAXON_ID=46948 /ORGANISM="Rhodomonas abbreviata, Strain Caron Lab Isolate" /LENGTH=380 /DNA_ID=CAMNT_0023400311 /DNA_START=1269 /DNA_END=2408 /DNA_ORIENTATION=-